MHSGDRGLSFALLALLDGSDIDPHVQAQLKILAKRTGSIPRLTRRADDLIGRIQAAAVAHDAVLVEHLNVEVGRISHQIDDVRGELLSRIESIEACIASRSNGILGMLRDKVNDLAMNALGDADDIEGRIHLSLNDHATAHVPVEL
ncbi:Uncharacterized protein PBTT_03447 [Plasmodiophora brassicae]|uniref:Uncharacterized protein n=1 Tax=Plasmodiophora brassicae TaxID=37360 RepID=A0A0G4IJ34_PLABS|nr:hypothetical protein PBRA_003979 [Plasmodiophora brassicae]SPQ96338.1 unnamed protein product [Plasmodiophora brassicae]